MIEVKDVSFAYHQVPVLDSISLSIKKGDFVAIIGPNGSGKTTLLQLLLGKLKPTKGTITLFGKPAESIDDWGNIGYVPQRITVDKLFPGTVQELLGTDTPPKTLGITELLQKQFSKLSGGQQQRVLIALALMEKPELLILDEPTVGIDLESQQGFYKLLKHINEDHGVTILFVTHDVGMIHSHFKNVICLNRSICCQGPAEETDKLLKQVYGDQFIPHTHK